MAATKTKSGNKKEEANTKQPPKAKIQNLYKGKSSLSFTLENAEILTNNLNKPYHSQEYDSYSSSVGILLTEDLKKEIYEDLALAYKNEKHLALALTDFLEKKVRVLESGKEMFYANVKFQVNPQTGELRPSKPLPVSGLKTEKFPFAFKGDVSLGFAFSQKFTFACYLNGVVIKEVVKQESDFSGLQTDSFFNPSIQVELSNGSDRNADEDEHNQGQSNEKEPETFLGKAKRKFFDK